MPATSHTDHQSEAEELQPVEAGEGTAAAPPESSAPPSVDGDAHDPPSVDEPATGSVDEDQGAPTITVRPDLGPEGPPPVLVLEPSPALRQRIADGLHERGYYSRQLSRMVDLLEPADKPGQWRLSRHLRRNNPQVLVANGALLQASFEMLSRWLATDASSRNLSIIVISNEKSMETLAQSSPRVYCLPSPPDMDLLADTIDSHLGFGSLQSRLLGTRHLWMNCQALIQHHIDLAQRHEFTLGLAVGCVQSGQPVSDIHKVRDQLMAELRRRLRRVDLVLPIANRECLVLITGKETAGIAPLLARIAPAGSWRIARAPRDARVRWSFACYPQDGENRAALFQRLESGQEEAPVIWDLNPREEQAQAA